MTAVGTDPEFTVHPQQTKESHEMGAGSRIALLCPMSMNAAVLHFTLDSDESSTVEELPTRPETGWSPMRWTREPAANDDVLIMASADSIIHSGDSGLAWVPVRRMK
jgi:hypothetical protein